MLHELELREAVKLNAEDRAYSKAEAFASKHNVEDSTLIIASDLEGPHLLGDTAVAAANLAFQGSVTVGEVEWERGAFMHQTTGTWFDNDINGHSWGQIGTSVSLLLPCLAVSDISSRQLDALAAQSTRVRGSDFWCEYVKNAGGSMVAVTTAWEEYHAPLAEDMDMTGLLGTEFNLERTRNLQKYSTDAGAERSMVESYMNDCQEIMDGISTNRYSQSDLAERIKRFYLLELGLSRDLGVHRAKRMSGIFHSDFGGHIERMLVMGNRGKKGAAQGLFDTNPDAVHIAIGDGSNDGEMLLHAPVSIGVNGRQAAATASYGLITPDMSVLAELTEIIRTHDPERTGNFTQVIQDANTSDAFQNAGALLHPGGRLLNGDLRQEIDPKYGALHDIMRIEMRGADGLILP